MESLIIQAIQRYKIYSPIIPHPDFDDLCKVIHTITGEKVNEQYVAIMLRRMIADKVLKIVEIGTDNPCVNSSIVYVLK